MLRLRLPRKLQRPKLMLPRKLLRKRSRLLKKKETKRQRRPKPSLIKLPRTLPIRTRRRRTLQPKL